LRERTSVNALVREYPKQYVNARDRRFSALDAVAEVFSEDFGRGQHFGALRARNPFLAGEEIQWTKPRQRIPQVVLWLMNVRSVLVDQRRDLLGDQADQEYDDRCAEQQQRHVGEPAHGCIGVDVVA